VPAGRLETPDSSDLRESGVKSAPRGTDTVFTPSARSIRWVCRTWHRSCHVRRMECTLAALRGMRPHGTRCSSGGRRCRRSPSTRRAYARRGVTRIAWPSAVGAQQGIHHEREASVVTVAWASCRACQSFTSRLAVLRLFAWPP